MPRAPKTQWDFGDLFTPDQTRNVLSVSDLTVQIKRSLEKGFTAVWVTGEISNFRMQSSGHAYFILKDAQAQVQAVLFRGQASIDRSTLRDGARVTLGGDITVYEPRGQYQLRVSHVEVQGVGALQVAFERLKAKLQSEGLFDPARKRTIPRFPRRVGLVTSPTGAAIQDVIHVIQRRFSKLELILAPTRVQGDGAASEVVNALQRLNQWSEQAPEHQKIDVLLLTRGGGSLEDLWTFNEESVARAVAASHLPIISAVGHEIDFTICDFVADFRAATPSAAAEILTEEYVASRDFVEMVSDRLATLARQRLDRSMERLTHAERRLVREHPRRRLEQRGQQLDDIQQQLSRLLQRCLRDRRSLLDHVRRRLSQLRPGVVVTRKIEAISILAKKLQTTAEARLQDHQTRITNLVTKLHLLSPQNVLNRGYSITQDATTGSILRSATAIHPGRKIRTRLQTGELLSTVTSNSDNPPQTENG